MAIVKSVRGFTPEIGDNTFLAEAAVVIGDVVIGKLQYLVWSRTARRVNSSSAGDRVKCTGWSSDSYPL